MSTYPGTLDTFNVIGTTNYMDEAGYVLHEHLNSHGSAIIQTQTTLGTNSGTSILKDFTAGEFAVARNAGGTLRDTITLGTINNAILGTPSITGGTFNAGVFGTPAITGGTSTNAVTTGGTVNASAGTINNAVFGTPAITGGTATSSAIVTPTLTLANATTMTTDGGILYDRTNERLLLGDGTNTQITQIGAWTGFTPDVTGAVSDIGNATLDCAYARVGKLVVARYKIVFGNSSSFTAANMTVALPVTASSSNDGLIGQFDLTDANGLFHPAFAYFNSTSTIIFVVSTIAAHTGTVYAHQTTATNAIPFTWTTSDGIRGSIVYEAA